MKPTFAFGTPVVPNSWRDLHRITGKAVTDYKLGLADSAALVERLDIARQDGMMSDLERNTLAYRHPVRQELDEIEAIRARDPKRFAQTALVFAILSAQLDFHWNVELTRNVMQALPNIDTVDDVLSLMFITKRDGSAGRISGYRNKAAFLTNALQGLRQMEPQFMTRETLAEWAMHAKRAGQPIGLGPKTIAMAVALNDEQAPVFTLDIWMFRALMSCIGESPAVRFSAVDKPYSLLEDWCLRWHRKAFAPHGLSVFEAQWTIWNLVGFGYHQPHVGIFAA